MARAHRSEHLGRAGLPGNGLNQVWAIALFSPPFTLVSLATQQQKSNSPAQLNLAAGWTAARRCRGVSLSGLARRLDGAWSIRGFRSRTTSGASCHGAARIGAGWPCPRRHAHAHRKPTRRGIALRQKPDPTPHDPKSQVGGTGPHR
jgi:hypothetical protein